MRVVSRGYTAIPDLLSTGQGVLSETFPSGTITNNSVPTSQTIYLGLVALRAGQTVAKVGVHVQTAGSGTAPTLIKVGLADTSGKLLAQSANLASDSGFTATGKPAFALASSYQVPADGSYYLVFLKNGTFSVTDVQIGRNQAIASVCAAVGSGARNFAVGGTGQTDLPANGSSVTLAAGTSTWWLCATA
jgi:hypothetical protein